MIITDLNQFALKLKLELEKSKTDATAQKIALEIKNAKHSDNTPLTETEKEHILKYLKYPSYDHITGKFALHFTDNSDFLKLVEVIAKSINQK